MMVCHVLAETQATEQRDSEELQRKLRENLLALSESVQTEGQEWEQQMREAYLPDPQARLSEESAERYAHTQAQNILWGGQGLMSHQGLDLQNWDKIPTTSASSPLLRQTSKKLAGSLVCSVCTCPEGCNLLISSYRLRNLST